MAFVKWHFLGGIRTVTGSCHALEVDGQRLLVDCGLFQGKRKEADRRNRDLPFDVASITRALLGHAHIDHCGNLPTLVRQGFHGSIYATHATRDLLALMLRDSAYIQRRDAEWVNKREKRRGRDRVEPLYDEGDVDFTDRRPDFEQLFNLKDDPEEKVNLIADYEGTELLAELRRKVAAHSESLNRQRAAYKRTHSVTPRGGRRK